MRHTFSQLEINTIFQLKAQGYNTSEIVDKINEQFNTNRTIVSIDTKLHHLTKNNKSTRLQMIQNDTIISFIKQYPTNITYALTLAADKLNIPFSTTHNRYYKYLKNNTTILTVGSEIGFSNNVKNTLRDINGNLPTPDMNDVQWLMKQILNLSEKDRNTIKLLLS